MPKKLLISFFAVCSVLFLLFVGKTIIPSHLSSSNLVNTSPFSNLTDYRSQGESSLYEGARLEELLKPLQQVLMSLGSDTYQTSGASSNAGQPLYWNDWDYRTKLVYGQILALRKDENTIDYKMDFPRQHENASVNKVTFVECDPKHTVLMNSSQQREKSSVKGDVSFFDEANIYDNLYTYCLSEDCSLIGKLCIIINSADK